MTSIDLLADAGLAGLLQAARRHDVSHGGTQLVWRSFGAGAPMVLLHGGHGSWLHWARNIPAWSQRFTVWVPDMPGYGDSDEAGEASLDALVSAVWRSLDTLVGSGASIVLGGFSFGGLAAARLAALRGCVRQMFLIGPAGHGGPRRPRGELRTWRHLETGGADWTAAMRHNLLMHMLHAENAVDATALRIHGHACIHTRFYSKGISHAGGLTAQLGACDAPLLLLWGEHDATLTPAVAAQSLAAGRRHCEVQTLAGAGHWAQYEAAGAVNSCVQAWLGP